MTEVALPNPSQPQGVGPFSGRAEIRDRSGVVLSTCYAEAWQISARPTSVGEAYNFAGRVRQVVGAGDLREHLIGKQNRLLVFEDGTEYRIVDATHHEILDYFDLQLRQVKPGG